MSEQNKSNLTWEALEFRPHRKNFLWYIIFGVLTTGLILYALYIQNWLSVITFACLAIAAFAFSIQRPMKIIHELTPTGIQLGETFVPYRNVKNFWIVFNQHSKTLNFETTAYINNVVTLQLGRLDPLAVKEYLKNYIPEDLNKQESFIDILARKIKF